MKKINKDAIIGWLNVLVLLSSMAIVVSLSYDILNFGAYNPNGARMLTIQLVVCSVFLLDFIVQVAIADRRFRFFRRNILLLLFSIPYINIVNYMHYDISIEVHYLIGLIPLLRAGFGLIIITRWLMGRNITSFLISYLAILLAVTYFSSLLFFVTERGINSEVNTYTDALWWACMDMTTVGSNVVAVTPIGKVLSVLLAASGMMMLPIFTVYITTIVTKDRNTPITLPAESSSNSGK